MQLIINNNISSYFQVTEYTIPVVREDECDCCKKCTTKMNEIMVLIKTLLDKSQKGTGNHSAATTNDIVDKYFIENLPCKSKNDAESFEEFLKTNPSLIHFVAKKLALVGGLTEKTFIARALESIVTTECLTQLTWGGTREKAGFKHFVHIK